MKENFDLPKIPNSTIMGDAGELLVSLILCGFANPKNFTKRDYGIDIEAELYKDNFPTGRTFSIQVKFVKDKPKIRIETKNYWSLQYELVYLVWIKSEPSHDLSSMYQTAINSIKQYKKYPSKIDMSEDANYKEFDQSKFVDEINFYWDKYDNNTINSPDKNMSSSQVEGNVKVKTDTRSNNESQMIGIIKSISNKISANAKLTDLETIRLFLFSSSQIYDKRITTEVLGNHEIQFLYKFKDKIILNIPEIILIARTIIGDTYKLRTGWYWTKFAASKDDFISIIESMVVDDRCEEVVKGAVEVLNYFWDERYIDVFSSSSLIENESVLIKVLDIIKQHPSKKTLEFSKKYINSASENINKKASETYCSIITTISPHESLDYILSTNNSTRYSINPSLYGLLEEPELRRLLNATDDYIRVDIIKELLSRDCLLISEQEKLLRDSNWNIKYIAVKSLISRKYFSDAEQIREILKPVGNSISDLWSRRIYEFNEDDLYREFYYQIDLSCLKSKMFWGFGGENIYASVGCRDNQFLETIRTDLIDGFEKRKIELIKKEALEKSISIDFLKDLWNKYDSVVKSLFTFQSLKILLEKGTVSDKKIAYKFIEDADYRIKDISRKILIKHSNSADTGTLLDMYRKEKSSKYISYAINVSAEKENLVKSLIYSSDNELTSYLIAYSLKNNIDLEKELLINHLSNADDKVRNASVVYILDKYDKKLIVKILKNYCEQDNYYYNVTSKLDMGAYSPSFLKKKLVSDQKSNLLKNIY